MRAALAGAGLATTAAAEDAAAVLVVLLPGETPATLVGPARFLPVLVLAPGDDAAARVLAGALGAVAVVPWADDAADLVRAVAGLLGADVPAGGPRPAEAGRAAGESAPSTPSTRATSTTLTERERAVARALAARADDAAIAELLGVSPRTARALVREVMFKLGVRRRDDVAAALARLVPTVASRS